MHAGLTALLLASGVVTLDVPAPIPEPPLRCVYEGVYAGTGVKARWTIAVGEEGSYTTEFADMAQVTGLLERRIGTHELTAVSATMTSTEVRQGPVLQIFDDLVVQLAGADAAPGGSIRNTVKRELVCPDRPVKNAVVGDVWTCEELIADSWTLTGSSAGPNRGTETAKREITYRYDRNESITGPEGAVNAAVLISQATDGPQVSEWIDPAAPWCPLKVERVRLEKIVGTDRLVERSRAPSVAASAESIVPREKESGNLNLHDMAAIIMLGFLIVVGIGFGAGWIAGRRHRRPPS